MIDKTIRTKEIEWYLQYGLYPRDRIKLDGDGNFYIIGDWSWNRNNPKKKETIEPKITTKFGFNKTLSSQ